MSQRVNIPSQNQPFRRQSSIGGNVSFRNIGENEDNSFITLAKVTRVYYKQGKLDFKLTNTNSLVADQSGNGSGSAPIPVDFFGRRPNGKVFGHYRPVKIGDLIAVAYINGHKSSPIVIGVYPNSGQDYEIISPSLYLDGDDNNSGIAETALAEQKIYPSMQLEYRSGSGTIAKALNGHSFLVVDDETSVQYSKLWQNYNTVGFFHSDSDDINPLKETAGDWLLIHEDNPLSDDGDNHRTRFFVNKKGEIQIVLMDNTSSGTISVLEGSKDNGFTISQYYDLTKTKSGDLSDDVYEPDFKSATDYVSLNIGKGKQIALDAAGQTKLVIKKDGIYYNGNPLSKAVINSESNNITKYVKDQITSSDYWKNFQDTINKASSEARDAAEQAKQAGEIAKEAGAAAEAAGKNALDTGDNIKKNVIYYANKYKGLHPGLHLDGDVVAITGKSYIEDSVINSAMIEDGAIDHAKIANEAVWSSQIANLAVTRAKIADAAIGSAQIEDLAVTDEKVGKLTFDHMVGATLDAGKINVINLTAESIKADTITADKLKIGELGDITDKLGTIADGKIIVKGNGSNSGVSLEGLDADNPDVYTPSKKAVLANIVHAIESSALASLDYAKQVGLDTDPVAKDLQTKYNSLVNGLAQLFQDMTATTNFDHNTVEKLTSDCNNAIDKFQNLANSQLNRKIGQTADNKNSVYQGYEQPANPHINDIWFQENSDGTYQIRVYDGGSWISPGMQDIKEVQESVSTLPRSYYSYTQPTGTDYKDGDIWYKTSTDTTNNTVVYTAYKWNPNTNTWDPLLDATSSHNYIGPSAPANPIDGDFWMDNTTLKQYQNGVWKTIPTQGPQGVPGVSAKQQYIHIAYATSADGNNNFSVDSFSGATYIGLLVDFDEEDSKDHTKYTWSLIKGKDGTDGKDGVPGKPGADGKTSYVHFAYANSSDGNTDFNLEYFANALYIGTYTDFTESDSSDHTKYTWSRLKGNDGTDGKDGVPGTNGKDGKTYYTWIKYATDSSGSNISDSPTGMSYIGIAYNKESQTESSTPTDYKWTKIKGDDGIPGAKGADGKTSYFHVAYANSSDGRDGFTTSPNISSSYRYLGTYTDYTSTSSRNPSSYTWAPMFDSTKKRNFTSQPTTPYAVGDTWTESGATYFCTVARDSGAFRQDDWEMQQLTIQSLAPSVTNSLYNDNLLTGTSEDELAGKSYSFADYQISGGLQPNKTYTLSGWARVDQDSLNHHQNVFVCVYSEDWSWGATLNINSALTSQYNKITFTTPNGKQLHPSVTVYLSHPDGGTNENNNDSISGKAYIKKLKLEKGSVATPWCLSQSELTTTTRDYRGVTLNDRGLTATAGSTTVAMNSNDGFLINNASGQVFHVDTSGNLNMKGAIMSEGTISGVEFIGRDLTLNNSLQVINGNISADNGNVVINSNGLTIKDGGLKIVDGNNETTTMIRDDGTFATNKGYFSGEVHTTKLILSGKDSDINMGGLFHVDSGGNVTAKSITITGGTVDAKSTKFNNFSADIITTGTLDANRVAVKNLSAGSITTGTLRSITINNGNNTFRVDPDGNVVANSIHVNNGSIYQGQVLGADLYSISNLTSNSLDEVNDATQNWVKLKDGIIELHGANGNHYSSIVPIDEVTTYSGDGGSTDVNHGLGILDSREVIIGSASLDSEYSNRITHSRNFDLISRTQLGITDSYIQAQLDPDGGEYGKGARFIIQKDNKVGVYVGDGDNGNELNVTTAGNYNHIAFNTNNFDIDGEVSIKNNHGLTSKNVHVTGWLGVDGSKNSIVRTSQGTVAINAYETAEYYFGDIGEGQTDSNGVAYVGIEKLFNETVNTSIPYQVFITAYGPGNVWVEQRKQDRFMVKSSQPNIKFGWEIKAKRKGYEHTRLQNVDNMIEKPAGIK